MRFASVLLGFAMLMFLLNSGDDGLELIQSVDDTSEDDLLRSIKAHCERRARDIPFAMEAMQVRTQQAAKFSYERGIHVRAPLGNRQDFNRAVILLSCEDSRQESLAWRAPGREEEQNLWSGVRPRQTDRFPKRRTAFDFARKRTGLQYDSSELAKDGHEDESLNDDGRREDQEKYLPDRIAHVMGSPPSIRVTASMLRNC